MERFIGTYRRIVLYIYILLYYTRVAVGSRVFVSIQNRKLFNIVINRTRTHNTNNIYRSDRKVCNNKYITYMYLGRYFIILVVIFRAFEWCIRQRVYYHYHYYYIVI